VRNLLKEGSVTGGSGEKSERGVQERGGLKGL